MTDFTEPMHPEILPRVEVASDLSIVKKILEDHGGKIWATSRLGNRHNYVFCSQKISGGTNEMSKNIN